jgi:hypothetical protein
MLEELNGQLLPWSGGYNHKDGRHHTGAVLVDCRRPTGRALVHGVGDRQAMSHPIESTSSGLNAIEGAYALYDSLRLLEDAHNEPRGNAHPVNFNLGRISGGNWASSVPSKCKFEVQVGFLPRMSIDDVKQDIKTTMRGRARELGLGLDIVYRGFHADGMVLLPEYVDGMAHVNNESVNSGSRSLQRDFVKTIQQSLPLQPNASPLRNWVHKMWIGFGIGIFIQFSPPPYAVCNQKDALWVGLGIF